MAETTSEHVSFVCTTREEAAGRSYGKPYSWEAVLGKTIPWTKRDGEPVLSKDGSQATKTFLRLPRDVHSMASYEADEGRVTSEVDLSYGEICVPTSTIHDSKYQEGAKVLYFDPDSQGRMHDVAVRVNAVGQDGQPLKDEDGHFVRTTVYVTPSDLCKAIAAQQQEHKRESRERLEAAKSERDAER